MKLYLLLVLVLTTFIACTQEVKEELKSAEKQSEKMKIEIWSDVACPFCYIGKHKFEEALAQFEQRDNIEVVWKSYQLDPTPQSEIPSDIDMYQYLAQRKGISYKESKKMHDNVSKMAKSENLEFNFDIAKISNTYDAARLIHLSKTINKSREVKEKLFEAHFTLGLDVADAEVLVNIGKEAGLDAEKIRTILQSEDYKTEVDFDLQEAQTIGVTGVPFFVFDRKYAVSGAQDVSVFLESISGAYADWKEKSEN